MGWGKVQTSDLYGVPVLHEAKVHFEKNSIPMSLLVPTPPKNENFLKFETILFEKKNALLAASSDAQDMQKGLQGVLHQ